MLDLVAAAEDNYLTTFRSVARLAPKGVTAEDGNLLHVFSGARLPTFNQTMVKSLPVSSDAVLDAAISFHADHQSPTWCITVRGSDAARFAEQAESRGFVHAETLPFMVLDATTVAATLERLAVRQVTDMESTREHLDLVARSFGAPFELLEPLLGGVFKTPTLTALIGDVDGHPAATSLLCVSNCAGVACAGVYNVGTLETHRGQGVGEAMTAHAAELGRVVHGCSIATLQSSRMGLPLYKRMGYRTVTEWQLWMPPFV